jgi:hypothetical protein
MKLINRKKHWLTFLETDRIVLSATLENTAVLNSGEKKGKREKRL